MSAAIDEDVATSVAPFIGGVAMGSSGGWAQNTGSYTITGQTGISGPLGPTGTAGPAGDATGAGFRIWTSPVASTASYTSAADILNINE